MTRLRVKFAVAAIAFFSLSLFNGVARADFLYAAQGGAGGAHLFILNPATGAVVRAVGALTDAGGGAYGISGLQFNPATHLLYGSTTPTSVTNPSHLLVINPTNGRVTDVGSFGFPESLADITLRAGTMYGLSGGTGSFYSVNQATG